MFRKIPKQTHTHKDKQQYCSQAGAGQQPHSIYSIYSACHCHCVLYAGLGSASSAREHGSAKNAGINIRMVNKLLYIQRPELKQRVD